MTPKEAHRAVSELIASPGWSYLRSIMREEAYIAALNIADPRPMDRTQIDFQRGAIWAAKQLLAMPERVLQKLEGDILLEESLNKADDARKQDAS